MITGECIRLYKTINDNEWKYDVWFMNVKSINGGMRLNDVR